MKPAEGFGDFVSSTLMIQLIVVVAPVLLLTLLLARSFRQTLILKSPPWFAVPAAAALAVVLHPSVHALSLAVMRLYPLGETMGDKLEAMEQMFVGVPLWQLLLLLAVTPAICEELAFRGFILSGLRHLGHKWRAIVYSAMLFGFSHGILQQSLTASLVGVVIGYLAVQSGSLWPGVVFHLVHNSIPVTISWMGQGTFDRYPMLRSLFGASDQTGTLYGWPAVLVSVVLATLILLSFQLLTHPKSEEEQQREADILGAR